MTRKTPNNPSGKWVRMNDEQLAREQAKFERAVERQVRKDAIRVGHDPDEAVAKFRAAKP